MNVNQKINGALSAIVDGNIWSLSCPEETPPDTYIVYNQELEKPEDFGDDRELEWGQYMQVHWFKRGMSKKKPVNYLATKKEIRKQLISAGFCISGIETFFEQDTGYTHLCFLCNITE